MRHGGLYGRLSAGEIMISWYNVFSVATCGALGGKSEKSDVLTFVERSQ